MAHRTMNVVWLLSAVLLILITMYVAGYFLAGTNHESTHTFYDGGSQHSQTTVIRYYAYRWVAVVFQPMAYADSRLTHRTVGVGWKDDTFRLLIPAPPRGPLPTDDS